MKIVNKNLKKTFSVRFFAGGTLVNERVPAFFLLKFLYFSRIGKIVRFFLTGRWLSKLYGFYQDSRLSARNIKAFVQKHEINMSDFERPIDQYKSFNDFFTRKLKVGARSIDMRPEVVVAPADSKVFAVSNLSLDDTFLVKNKRFNLERFLGSKQLAQSYQDGCCMVFRLAPPDYHRFHFCVSCVPAPARIIAGKYESVNPVAYAAGVQSLIENERHIIELKKTPFGDILMVPVGALFVGRIVETYKADILYEKGTEAGYFACGGSTIVLLFKKGQVTVRSDIYANSLSGFETAVKCGQIITL
ncbi:MAG: archaetidylserine decarboxylase [bacterium]